MCQQCFLAIHVQILIEQTVTWDYRLICSTGWFAMLPYLKLMIKFWILYKLVLILCFSKIEETMIMMMIKMIEEREIVLVNHEQNLRFYDVQLVLFEFVNLQYSEWMPFTFVTTISGLPGNWQVLCTSHDAGCYLETWRHLERRAYEKILIK